ncbi:MAG: sulfotransferase [Calditrichaeota bacterium]|nr:sulfotransferase [Calditrichota bacterium]
MSNDFVTVVSGLPRSGTSMMMRILDSGGMEIVVDGIRTADDDNPKGYYELEQVKKLKEDKNWVKDTVGKGVKVISALLTELPPEYNYKVIFMRRRMEEILASQKKMLIRRGEPTDTVPDEIMAREFEKHLEKIEKWLAEQSNMDVLYVTYHEAVADPEGNIKKVNAFLGNRLDEEKMMAAIDKNLYRNRAAK